MAFLCGVDQCGIADATFAIDVGAGCDQGLDLGGVAMGGGDHQVDVVVVGGLGDGGEGGGEDQLACHFKCY